MKRDAIDLGNVNVFKLFNRYFIPTLLGMLCRDCHINCVMTKKA